MTRLQLSRHERELRQRRIIVIGAIVVGLLTIGLIAAAAIQIGVVEPSRTVASVGGQPISVQNLQKRMSLTQNGVAGNANQLRAQLAQLQQGDQQQADFLGQFYQQQYQQIVAQGSAEAIATQSYQTMVDDLLVRQEAARRGITVSAEEVQQELEKSLGYYRATLTPFPTQPAEPTVVVSGTAIVPPTTAPRLQPTSIGTDVLAYELAKRVTNLQPLGYNEQDLRAFIESDLYSTRLRDTIGNEVATSSPHVQFDFVRFNVITDALKAADRLAKNEIRFDALISETNAITLPASIGAGQSVEWTSESQVRSLYGAEVFDVLSYKSIGAPTGVVTSTNGSIYVLLPKGRETRELQENELTQAKRDKYDEWLNAARLDTNIVKKELDPTTVIPAPVRSAAAAFASQHGGQ